MHDSNLWGHITIRQFCESWKLAPYALIGDATYFPCPWMFPPFEGHKDGLSKIYIYIKITYKLTLKCA
jgi:hypothetical protein